MQLPRLLVSPTLLLLGLATREPPASKLLGFCLGYLRRAKSLDLGKVIIPDLDKECLRSRPKTAMSIWMRFFGSKCLSSMSIRSSAFWFCNLGSHLTLNVVLRFFVRCSNSLITTPSGERVDRSLTARNESPWLSGEPVSRR